jgi:hypothetical protein
MPPKPVATPFGADDQTIWVQPAVAQSVSGAVRSGRRLPVALTAVALLAASGVAIIASGADAGTPRAPTPAVVAQMNRTAPPAGALTTSPPIPYTPPISGESQ